MSLTAKKGGTQNKTYSNEQYEQRKTIYNNKLWVYDNMFLEIRQTIKHCTEIKHWNTVYIRNWSNVGKKEKNINQEIQFPIKQFLIQRHMLKNTCK